MADAHDDARSEAKRQAMEDAYLALHPELAQELGLDRPVPGLPDALRTLADAEVPRVLKHRLLLQAAQTPRHDVRRDDVEGAVREVLHSTLDYGPEDETREDAVEHALRVLHDFQDVRDLAEPAPAWDRWVEQTHPVFQFALHERTISGCDDRRTSWRRNVGEQFRLSRLIVAQFWTDLPPAAFAEYVNPEKWPACSSFWEAMEPKSAQTAVGEAGGYDCDFEERVWVYGRLLRVPLRVGYRVSPTRVWTRFNMVRGASPADVDVDTGTVSAEALPGGPAATLVQATKYLHWVNPRWQAATSLVCDLGYVELMQEMATRCGAGQPDADLESQLRKPDVEKAIERLVADVATECKKGIDGYKPHARSMVGRFTGASWDLGWINDVLEMGRVSAKTYGEVGNHVRRFADTLRGAREHEEKGSA